MTRPEIDEYEALIPELREWNNGRGIDVDTWLHCMGSYELTIAFERLFWPEFVIHRDCLVRSGFDSREFEKLSEWACGDKKKVELAVNVLSLEDLFHTGAPEPTDQQLLRIGKLLQEMWISKLGRDFPDRKIVVELSEEHNELEITVFQEHSGVD